MPPGPAGKSAGGPGADQTVSNDPDATASGRVVPRTRWFWLFWQRPVGAPQAFDALGHAELAQLRQCQGSAPVRRTLAQLVNGPDHHVRIARSCQRASGRAQSAVLTPVNLPAEPRANEPQRRAGLLQPFARLVVRGGVPWGFQILDDAVDLFPNDPSDSVRELFSVPQRVWHDIILRIANPSQIYAPAKM